MKVKYTHVIQAGQNNFIADLVEGLKALDDGCVKDGRKPMWETFEYGVGDMIWASGSAYSWYLEISVEAR